MVDGRALDVKVKSIQIRPSARFDHVMSTASQDYDVLHLTSKWEPRGVYHIHIFIYVCTFSHSSSGISSNGARHTVYMRPRHFAIYP